MVVTEIVKIGKCNNCLIIPKSLIRNHWGDVKIVGIEKTAEGIELSKIK